MRSIFLTVFSLVCFTGVAQIDAFQQDIIDYLNINGTQKQYAEAYDDMFQVLRQNFETSNIPETVWTDLKSGKGKSMDEITEFLSFAYRKHFTQAEIKTMTDFYKTEAAQKMLNQTTGALSEAENGEITAYFDSEIAKKVESKLPELSVDISEISNHWSRDLFKEKMEALLNLGYRPKQ